MALDDIAKLDEASTVHFGGNVTAEEVESLFSYLAAKLPAEITYFVEHDKFVGPSDTEKSEQQYRSEYSPETRSTNVKKCEIHALEDLATCNELGFECLSKDIEISTTKFVRFYGLKFGMFGRDRLTQIPNEELALIDRVRELTRQYFSKMR